MNNLSNPKTKGTGQMTKWSSRSDNNLRREKWYSSPLGSTLLMTMIIWPWLAAVLAWILKFSCILVLFLNHTPRCFCVNKRWSQITHAHILQWLGTSLDTIDCQGSLWVTANHFRFSLAFDHAVPSAQEHPPPPRIPSRPSTSSENKHGPSCSLENTGAGLENLPPHPWVVSSCCFHSVQGIWSFSKTGLC